MAEEAEHIFTGVLESDPASADAMLGLAEVALYRQDWNEFARWAGEAERRISETANPELVSRLISLLVFAPTGRERAQEFLKHRIDLQPRDGMARVTLALLQEESAPNDSRQHLEDARKYLSADEFDQLVDSTRRLLQRWGPEWWQDPPE